MIIEKYVIPNLIIVGYGKSQIIMAKCFKCNNRFIQNEQEDCFCDYCQYDEKYIPEDSYCEIKHRGNIIDFEIEVAANRKRSSFNYKKVLKRDKYQCQYCGYHPSLVDEFIPISIDHIKPHFVGGNNSMENLITSCMECNKIASSKWFDSFIDKKIYIYEKRKNKELGFYWEYCNKKLIEIYSNIS